MSAPGDVGHSRIRARPRIDSVDLLRGVVMVVMTLDHTRDFAARSGFDPRDVTQPALFVTRWITHFCAPVFVFLAGTSAYLYGQRGKRPAEVTRFLFTRGLWLVFLELTLVRWGWTFDIVPRFVGLQVIWAIGWSMVALSVLHRLPFGMLAIVSLTMIAGHNLLDGITSPTVGWWWNFVHASGPLPAVAGVRVFVAYALIPWIGVMSAGYCFGTIILEPPEKRRRALLAIGFAAIAAFMLLRWTNVYGDPASWSWQATPLRTVLSFVNCEKYPPSLLFLLMTLGPAILFLALVDGFQPGPISRQIVTIGRVPLFYYLLHLPLIHGTVLLLAVATYGADFLTSAAPMTKPPGFGYSLPIVYALWVLTVLVLLPACRWFAAVKQRRTEWWLSYL